MDRGAWQATVHGVAKQLTLCGRYRNDTYSCGAEKEEISGHLKWCKYPKARICLVDLRNMKKGVAKMD